MALAVGEVVNRVFTLALVASLTRSLGVDGFGLLSFGLAVATYGTLVGRAGLDLWGNREAARGGSVARLAGRVIAVRAPLALTAFLLMLAFAALQPNATARPAISILALLILVDWLNLPWVFLGLERMGLVTVATNLSTVLVVVAVLLFVQDSSHVELAALLTVAGELAGAALLLGAFVRHHGWPVVRLDVSFSRGALGQSLPFAAVAVLGAVRFNFDVILLGLLLGETQTGLYSGPYRILLFLIAISAAYFTSLLPTLVRSHPSDPTRGQQLVRRAIWTVAVFVLPTAVGGTVLAEDVVTLLLGAEFRPSADVFRVLVWALVPLCLAGGYRNLLRAWDRQSLEMRAVAWSAAVNVALNLALIPTVGLVGAATATLVGELVLLGTSWHATRGLLERSITPGVILRPLVAASAMGLVLALAPARPLAVSLAIGPLVYFPALFLLGGLTRADVRKLRQG